jgi:uncharacterized cupredoxin-like copper-binding protein
VVAATAATLLAVIAAPVAGKSGSASATTVRVTMTDLKFALSTKSVARGTVVFAVANKGKLGHDFKIAGKKTAVLRPGKTAKLSVTFKKAGKYPYVCTVPGHAAGGMRGVLTVR